MGRCSLAKTQRVPPAKQVSDEHGRVLSDAKGEIQRGLGVLVWSPLAGGLMSGKYRREGTPTAGRHVGDWAEPPVRGVEAMYDVIDVLVESMAPTPSPGRA